ncbi:MAG: electron transport complex subunit RsxC [Alphaproteobacteria bacterium CG_4_10_14_0_2_um_filter_63_37]|nr:MAG: hypothetical protein AUJ55_11935 [Proteobacteria bacterium CG1_02_64_396]PJA26033.1 MAG: electron transport complex subunit RsxC [Alphaproteobacteria bacterium CG_4_10_14_0_2_um_filter_63_37]
MLVKLVKGALGHTFARGGVHPPTEKKATQGSAIETLDPQGEVILALNQHIGSPALPVVAVGDRVFVGTTVARATGFISAPLHSSVSGTVTAIENRPSTHASGLAVPCIVIASDGQFTPDLGLKALGDCGKLGRDTLREAVRLAGLTGLGGASFPTAVKLSPPSNHPVETLVLNGVECEPFLTCDHRLMLEAPEAIIAGGRAMARAVGAANIVIAIEANKPDAIAAMKQAAAPYPEIGVEVLPVRYPQGSEKQLIQALFGLEVPSHGLPLDVGLVVQNVGTAWAVHHLLTTGEPLVSRVVTVTGPLVPRPKNLRVRLGTPLREILAACGVDEKVMNRATAILGGPMMGTILLNPDAPLVKGIGGILVMDGSVQERNPDPCIRCARCVTACPTGLLPNELGWFAKTDQFERSQEYDLFDCIECGCCAFVCPSRIPLVHYFRYAKSQIWFAEREKRKADEAKERSDAKKARIEREEEEKRRKREEVKAKMAAAKQEADATKVAQAAEETSGEQA